VLHNSGPSTELLRPSALILKHAEHAGDAIGYVGRYEGQFHFLGRLTHPIDELTPAALAGLDGRASERAGDPLPAVACDACSPGVRSALPRRHVEHLSGGQRFIEQTHDVGPSLTVRVHHGRRESPVRENQLGFRPPLVKLDGDHSWPVVGVPGNPGERQQ
jgi:hypothetical protein